MPNAFTSKMPDHKPAINIVQREGISAIWLVPIIAVFFASWLFFKGLSERGVFIQIQFDSVSGIVVGKTEVRYKGLTIGVVKSVEVAENLRSVIVEIEMIASTKDMLTNNTQFWYVTADVSMQGVSGLETLFSGSYINISPDVTGEGESQREFIALQQAPPLDVNTAGLHITLKTNTLGSLSENSQVTFKQIPVGKVSGFDFDSDNNQVYVNIFIEPEYAHFVQKNSRFWNASGISMTGSITTGINVKTGSLSSILLGGIAFDNEIEVTEERDSDLGNGVIKETDRNGLIYQLYADHQSAKVSHEIDLVLAWNSGLDLNAAIIFQGIQLGKVVAFNKIDPDNRKIYAKAIIDPRLISYLTQGSEFYVVSPKIDFSGTSDMHTILMGAYLGFRPSLSGEPVSTFDVYNQKPAYKYSEPGLHLILQANDISSLVNGGGVYFKKQKVGSIQAIDNDGVDRYLVHIYIKPEFQHQVSKNTKFWHASGVRVSGNLQSFEIQAQSVQSLLAGGIAFNSGKIKTAHGLSKPKDIGVIETKRVRNGSLFKLLKNQYIAKQNLMLTLNANLKRGLALNTRVMYRGDVIGSIHQIKHQHEDVQFNVGIYPEYEYILREKTQFWLVRPQVTLSGLTDTDAIFGGSYISLSIGDGEVSRTFELLEKPPIKHFSAKGLQLQLTLENSQSINAGSPIIYKGVAVGQVDNVSLDNKDNQVNVSITIDENYRQLVNQHSRFYNATGLSIKGSVGSFTVKTASVDTVLRGGISFYNPIFKTLLRGENKANVSQKVNEGDVFRVFDDVSQAESAGIGINIHFNDVSGLKVLAKIKYLDQDIGTVEKLLLNDNHIGVTVIASLRDSAKGFAVQGSKFWIEQTEFGLVGNRNLTSIIEGSYINTFVGDGDEKTNFIGEDIAPTIKKLSFGLNIKLSSQKLGSIRIGDPVLYRQIKVGQVIGVDLSPSADTVDVFINISKKYTALVTPESKFWHASGLKIDAGIFSGVRVDMESIETLLAGGIAFATPKAAPNKLKQETQFLLHQEPVELWLNWQPKIVLK